MAFGRNKNEVFQRVVTVKDEPEKPQKNKKVKKEKEVDQPQEPAADTSMWKASSDYDNKPERFEAARTPAAAVDNPESGEAGDAATGDAAENSGSAVREVGASAKDSRPVIEMSAPLGVDEGEITGGMYSDSGRTVTMAMRLVSYLLYICGPLYFVGKIFVLVGTEADKLTTGLIASTVIDGVIGAVLLISAGILVVGLIKILQNLMALQKKKKKR